LLCAASRRQRGFTVHSWDGHHYPADARTCWYTPFVVRDGQVSRRPSFYALALFTYALGRRFCGVSTSAASGLVVRTWAVHDPATGRIYAFVLNNGRAGRVSVTVPAGHPRDGLPQRAPQRWLLLKDPLIEGTRLPPDGVYSWSGRPLGAVSGTRRYEVDLPECSAALLSLPCSPWGARGRAGATRRSRADLREHAPTPPGASGTTVE
jgi:hypothetical protein